MIYTQVYKGTQEPHIAGFDAIKSLQNEFMTFCVRKSIWFNN